VSSSEKEVVCEVELRWADTETVFVTLNEDVTEGPCEKVLFGDDVTVRVLAVKVNEMDPLGVGFRLMV